MSIATRLSCNGEEIGFRWFANVRYSNTYGIFKSFQSMVLC